METMPIDLKGTLVIRYNEVLPDEQAYFDLFESTGWNAGYRVTPGELREALERSWHMVQAYDGMLLVGTGRVISDGKLHALIVDVVVLPEYQGRGIGTDIMLRLLERCRLHGIRDVQLFSAPGKAAFYEELGFAARQQDAPGMELSKQDPE